MEMVQHIKISAPSLADSDSSSLQAFHGQLESSTNEEIFSFVKSLEPNARAQAWTLVQQWLIMSIRHAELRILQIGDLFDEGRTLDLPPALTLQAMSQPFQSRYQKIKTNYERILKSKGVVFEILSGSGERGIAMREDLDKLDKTNLKFPREFWTFLNWILRRVKPIRLVILILNTVALNQKLGFNDATNVPLERKHTKIAKELVQSGLPYDVRTSFNVQELHDRRWMFMESGLFCYGDNDTRPFPCYKDECGLGQINLLDKNGTPLLLAITNNEQSPGIGKEVLEERELEADTAERPEELGADTEERESGSEEDVVETGDSDRDNNRDGGDDETQEEAHALDVRKAKISLRTGYMSQRLRSEIEAEEYENEGEEESEDSQLAASVLPTSWNTMDDSHLNLLQHNNNRKPQMVQNKPIKRSFKVRGLYQSCSCLIGMEWCSYIEERCFSDSDLFVILESLDQFIRDYEDADSTTIFVCYWHTILLADKMDIVTEIRGQVIKGQTLVNHFLACLTVLRKQKPSLNYAWIDPMTRDFFHPTEPVLMERKRHAMNGKYRGVGISSLSHSLSEKLQTQLSEVTESLEKSTFTSRSSEVHRWVTEGELWEIFREEIMMYEYHCHDIQLGQGGRLLNCFFPLLSQVVWSDPVIWSSVAKARGGRQCSLIAVPCPLSINYDQENVYVEGGDIDTDIGLLGEFVCANPTDVEFYRVEMMDHLTHIINSSNAKTTDFTAAVKEYGQKIGTGVSENHTMHFRLHGTFQLHRGHHGGRISIPLVYLSAEKDTCENGQDMSIYEVAWNTLRAPSVDPWNHPRGEVEGQFEAAAALKGISPLSDALTCRGDWQNPLVMMEAAHYLKRLDPRTDPLYLHHRKKLRESVIEVWERIKALEKQLFGKESYFHFKDKIVLPEDDLVALDGDEEASTDLSSTDFRKRTRNESITTRDPKRIKRRGSSDDILFQQGILRGLARAAESRPSHENLTWGEFNDRNVHEYLMQAKPPIYNPNGVGDPQCQAHFLTEEEASTMLSSLTPVSVPIFVESPDSLPWEPEKSRIAQLLGKYQPSQTVEVNKANTPMRRKKETRKRVKGKKKGNGRRSNENTEEEIPSYSTATIESLKAQFLSKSEDDTDRWNVLDLKVPFPETWGTCPSFLRNTNCSLLSRLKDRFLNSGSAGRPRSTVNEREWLMVERWMLLAEAGSNTMSHQDSYGYETFITVTEGDFGFGWLDRPSQEQLQGWATNISNYQGGRWCFKVLPAGTTCFFGSGTTHFVVRSENTLALGGHLLRHSNIVKWVQTMAFQLTYPEATNENIDRGKVADFLELNNALISQARDEGKLDLFGGETNLKLYMAEVKKCCSILADTQKPSPSWKQRLKGIENGCSKF